MKLILFFYSLLTPIFLHSSIGPSFVVFSLQFFMSALELVQLYVSVDAATKEKLKAIDRPLFSDFWERFIVSIMIC